MVQVKGFECTCAEAGGQNKSHHISLLEDQVLLYTKRTHRFEQCISIIGYTLWGKDKKEQLSALLSFDIGTYV